MSRDERYGTRSMVYSKWHRLYLGSYEPMIDLDAVEYCPERGCSKPLVLIETARDVGQQVKPTTVLRNLASDSQTLALCVLYRISSGTDELLGCDCGNSRNMRVDCDHGICRFRVRRIWPPPNPGSSAWTSMDPEQFRDRLRAVRMSHIATVHAAWEAA